MFIFDIGPAYIRSAIILKENDPKKEYLTKELENNKDKFESITDLSMNYKDMTLFFLKINLFRLSAFKKSYDYEVILKLISKNNDNNEEFCKIGYFCGHLTEKLESVIENLLQVKCVKLGHVNQLSVYGLKYIADNVENAFFNLPGQSIYNLVQVGHKLNEVTQKNYVSLKDSLFPFLMANIMEGTSIYKVEADDKFTRIGGTSFGSTTYWSLVSMTYGYDDPEVAVKDALKGNNQLIDLSVGDIYGGTYETFNLNSSLIASSFGKLRNVSDISEVNKEDVSRSLLTLFCVIVSQTTAMLAQTSNVNKVIIVGNPFNNLESMQMVQMATNYFSGDTVSAYFSDYAPFINLIGMCRQMELENIEYI